MRFTKLFFPGMETDAFKEGFYANGSCSKKKWARLSELLDLNRVFVSVNEIEALLDVGHQPLAPLVYAAMCSKEHPDFKFALLAGGVGEKIVAKAKPYFITNDDKTLGLSLDELFDRHESLIDGRICPHLEKFFVAYADRFILSSDERARFIEFLVFKLGAYLSLEHSVARFVFLHPAKNIRALEEKFALPSERKLHSIYADSKRAALKANLLPFDSLPLGEKMKNVFHKTLGAWPSFAEKGVLKDQLKVMSFTLPSSVIGKQLMKPISRSVFWPLRLATPAKGFPSMAESLNIGDRPYDGKTCLQNAVYSIFAMREKGAWLTFSHVYARLCKALIVPTFFPFLNAAACINAYLRDQRGGLLSYPVVDISAGWLDRYNAAALLGAGYYGFDPQMNSSPYQAAVHKLESIHKEFLGEDNGLPRVVSGECAETGLRRLSSEGVRTALVGISSPPYANMERYGEGTEHESQQAWAKYTDYNAWLAGFLKPILEDSCSLLLPGGRFVLNVADVFLLGRHGRTSTVSDAVKTVLGFSILGSKYALEQVVPFYPSSIGGVGLKKSVEVAVVFQRVDVPEPGPASPLSIKALPQVGIFSSSARKGHKKRVLEQVDEDDTDSPKKMVSKRVYLRSCLES